MTTPRPERRQSDLPPVWKLRWDPTVLSALELLSNGRCAFCERAGIPLEPYRFRPPGYASPILPAEEKDSYLWLAFAWSNLFPVCAQCRPLDPNHFPVNGDRVGYDKAALSKDPGLDLGEDPVFVYPGELALDPSSMFEVTTGGELVGRPARGAPTIAHFNLNRPDLRSARAAKLDPLVRSMAGERREHQAIDQGAPFAGIQLLFLCRLVSEIYALHPRISAPRDLNPNGVSYTLNRWADEIDLGAATRQALELMQAKDSSKLVRLARSVLPPPRRAAPTDDRNHAPIRSVTITTFKSLESVDFKLDEKLSPAPALLSPTDTTTISPEAPCLLILGENASGKSSILEAVALACLKPADGRRLRPKEQVPSLTLNPEYMGLEGGTPEPESLIRVEFHDGRTRTLRIDGRKDAATPLSWAAGRTRPLVFAYGAHRLFAGKRRHERLRHVDTLFSDDRQLSNPEDWLRELWETNRDALDEVVSALRHIIQIDGRFESIHFADDLRGGKSRCIIRLKKKRPDGGEQIVPQPLAVVSSGFRAILALVCDILDGLLAGHQDNIHEARMSRAIVLIDEIEAHLHPRWKLHVIGGLRRALPRVTFILTSHDPLCVRGMRNGEVMALNRYHNAQGDGLGLPERVERVAGFDQVETMTVDQLLTSDLFQLLSADDAATERDLAAAADVIASGRPSSRWTDDEKSHVAGLDEKIRHGLPVGRNEVTRLVQEAVAEFLVARRQADAGKVSAARKKAKSAVKSYLRSLVR